MVKCDVIRADGANARGPGVVDVEISCNYVVGVLDEHAVIVSGINSIDGEVLDSDILAAIDMDKVIVRDRATDNGLTVDTP